MDQYYFLFGVALVWIIFATVHDIRKREVANWLNFSLLAIALAYRGFYSIYTRDINFLLFGVIGFGILFGLANIFYYSKAFAGGDAKLLMALGAVIPFDSYSSLLFFSLSFVFLLFLVGSIYSIIYSLFLVMNNKVQFKKEFSKRFRDLKYYILVVSLLVLVIVAVFYRNIIGFAVLWVVILLEFLYVYLKSLDVCMVKLVKPAFLGEGDWLINDIKVGKNTIRSTVHGLTAKDIALLRKAKKSVFVKEGIPFVPAFLFAFIIMVFFYLYGLLDLSVLFASLS